MDEYKSTETPTIDHPYKLLLLDF